MNLGSKLTRNLLLYSSVVRKQHSFLPKSVVRNQHSFLPNCGLLIKKRQVTTLANMLKQVPYHENFFFRQLFDNESSTYTYLLGDIEAKECILIDPVLEQVNRDFLLVKDLGFKLKYAMNTHVHADHVTGTGLLKSKTSCRSLISKASGAKADVYVNPGDEVHFGQFSVSVRPTPGHTNGCVTYVCESQGIAFTGDALLIRGCGRTDFQEGDSATLYESVHTQIFSLPDNFKLFPAHDYKGFTSTSVLEEKALNPRLTKTKDEFIEIMANLNLAYPKKIDIAVPANKICGIQDYEHSSVA